MVIDVKHVHMAKRKWPLMYLTESNLKICVCTRIQPRKYFGGYLPKYIYYNWACILANLNSENLARSSTYVVEFRLKTIKH